MGGGSCSDYDYSDRATTKSAKSYSVDDGRNNYVRPSRALPAPRGMEIESKNERGLVFILDVTGSMADWPGMILEKLPTFFVETNNAIQGITPEYAEKNKDKLKEVLDVSIIAIGDAEHDAYPIQVTDFAGYESLQEKVRIVYPEGGGGGNSKESYDLGIYFALKHCKTADKNPICIIAGDEGFYNKIKPQEIEKYIGDSIGESTETSGLLKALSEKFELYVLRKEYSRYEENAISSQWKGVLGDRVIKMSSAGRLVDAAIVAGAHASGNIDVGFEWIKRRQTAEQVKEVEDSFKDLAAVTKNKKTAKKTKNDSGNLDDLLNELHPFGRGK